MMRTPRGNRKKNEKMEEKNKEGTALNKMNIS